MDAETAPSLPLKGRRIALVEARQIEVLAAMLEKQGAEAVRCPLVAIRDAPDPAPVEAWLRRLIADDFNDLILYTGEGLRRLTGFAERAGLREGFVAALGRVRKITRGPKPVRALRELDLAPDITAAAPTTGGVIETLAAHDLHGRTIGVQLYGLETLPELMRFLREKGAAPVPVSPYVYVPAAENERVVALIDDLAAGRLDAVAFTSAAQVERLAEVAEEAGLSARLEDGLARTPVAVIGPVAADAFTRRFARAPDAEPDTPNAMKPLIKSISDLFAHNG